jgi:carboxypeptidase D
MLYLDQPSQVGFSYDVPTNGTMNLPDLRVIPTDFKETVPEQNNTFRAGTFAS